MTRTVYVDSSALVKLIVDESHAGALRRYLADASLLITTSALSRVEVHRAVAIANPGAEARDVVDQGLESWRLVAVADMILRDAAAIASMRVRSLDAIHLASARAVRAVEFITYDQRLADAAHEHGMHVVQPGIGPKRGRIVHDRGG